MASFVSCILRRHQPDRQRVLKTTDGAYYARCQCCGAPLRRAKIGLWRRDWLRTFGLRRLD